MTLFRFNLNARLRRNISLKSSDKCRNKNKTRRRRKKEYTLQQLVEVHSKWKVKHNQSINEKFTRKNGISSIIAVSNWRRWRRIYVWDSENLDVLLWMHAPHKEFIVDVLSLETCTWLNAICAQNQIILYAIHHWSFECVCACVCARVYFFRNALSVTTRNLFFFRLFML